MKQEIPCKGVEKNEEVIFKYSTNFYRQFNNKQFISYWIFLFKCCTQLPCLATCLGYLSDKEQQTVADDTPVAQLLQQMLHETRKNERGRQLKKWGSESQMRYLHTRLGVPVYNYAIKGGLITSPSPRCSSKAKPQPTTTANDAGSRSRAHPIMSS